MGGSVVNIACMPCMVVCVCVCMPVTGMAAAGTVMHGRHGRHKNKNRHETKQASARLSLPPPITTYHHPPTTPHLPACHTMPIPSSPLPTYLLPAIPVPAYSPYLPTCLPLALLSCCCHRHLPFPSLPPPPHHLLPPSLSLLHFLSATLTVCLCLPAPPHTPHTHALCPLLPAFAFLPSIFTFTTPLPPLPCPCLLPFGLDLIRGNRTPGLEDPQDLSLSLLSSIYTCLFLTALSLYYTLIFSHACLSMYLFYLILPVSL